MIDVRLLGPPTVVRAGRPVGFDTRKAVALLAYLALADRPRSRDSLADLLWSDSDPDHARGALRRTLSTLRSAIGAEAVEATRDHVRLRPDAGLTVDVHEFRAAVASGDLAAAAELARGELLEGFTVSGASDFEDWQRAEADRLRDELAEVLASIAVAREGADDLAGAVAAARRRLALDRLHEPAHRELMRLLALTGDRASAVAQYRACVAALARELGVAPLRETTALYEAIGQGQVPRRAARPAVSLPAEPTPPGEVPLVGRDAVLGELLTAYEGSTEHGRVAVVEGEAGVGKTRLVDELVARVRQRGGVALVGRAYRDEQGLAFAPVVGALRDRVATAPDGAAWVARLPAWARPAAAALVPEVAANPAEHRPGVGAAAHRPGAAETFLAGVWETLTTAVASDRPGLLVVEDVQWADESTQQLVAYGLRRLAGRRLLVVLTWRTPDDRALRRVVGDLRPTGTASVHRLDRLGPADAAALVRAVRPGADPRLVEHLTAYTEGLPLLLVEYLRSADLQMPSAGDAPQALPVAIRDVLRSRLDPVGETARQVLAAAAVLGRSFDVAEVRATSGRTAEEVVDALEELTASGLVRERAPAGGPHTEPAGPTPDYDFSHDLVRAMVAETTSLARRRLLHARAAAMSRDPAAVARHLRLAGHDTVAAEAYVRAADTARAVFANAEALDHLRSALALGHPDAARLHVTVGELLTLQGDYAGALTSLETAVAAAPEAMVAEIEHRIGQVHLRRGARELARTHLAVALEAAEDDRAAARITADLALVAHADGDPEQARALAAQAADRAASADDPAARAQADNLRGLLAASAGRPAEAITHLASSLAAAALVTDPAVRVAALNNLALAHRAQGDLARALELTREALERCAAYGDRHREAALLNNLADLLHAAGEPEEAMQHLKRAVARFAEIGSAEGPQPEIWRLVAW